jgi:hypothetical protein
VISLQVSLKKMERRYGYPKEKQRHAKKHDPKKTERRIKGIAMSKDIYIYILTK